MKILICVCAYNRKKMSELMLSNLYKYKQDADLWIYNDHSTDFRNDFLEQFADRVILLPPSKKKVVKNEKNKKGMGVQHLRWHQFREVAESDYDAVYMTDNDAFHDPEYITVLKDVMKRYTSKKGKMPVCLYNTRWHSQPENLIKEGKDVLIRRTAPGVSQFYTKQHCQDIVKALDKEKQDPDYGWDYHVSNYLKLPFVTTKASFVEHFGADEESMHSGKGQWDRDRAQYPTEYLATLRTDIINYLEGKGEKPEI